MKKIILPCLLLAATFATAQPSIQWQKTYGGSFATNDIRAESLTTDGGYILAGSVSTRNQALLVKLDAQGNKEWKKLYGGSETEKFFSIEQTSDGGYIAAGSTSSNDGDVSGLHNNAGLDTDIWVVKLDASGNITWQKCIGGSNDDGYQGAFIKQTTDGYVIASTSNSLDGDIAGNHGRLDVVIIKLNSAGDIQWQKSLGGTNEDLANAIQQTRDGGYIIAAVSTSNDGDVSGHHGSSFSNDYWILKLDATGNITWQNSFGGTKDETPYSIQQTTDDGYVIAGSAFSDDGDVTDHIGSHDYWVVKINSGGTLVWQKCLGGTGYDKAWAIQQTTEGGYIVCGNSYSNDGDVSGHNLPLNYTDAWVVKLTGDGNISWQKCVGTNKIDNAYDIKEIAGGYVMVGSTIREGYEAANYWFVKLDGTGNTVSEVAAGASDGNDLGYSSVQTSDGGYIMVGNSSSADGDVTSAHGDYDCWVVKTNSSGTIEWQKSYGGSGKDYGVSILQTGDGGYIFAGQTFSNDGDVTGNHGLNDGWVVKLDASGNITWQKALGGTGEDYLKDIIQTSDGGYIMEGATTSNDGDVTGNHGGTDHWVVKLDASGNISWQKCLGGTNNDYGYAIRQTTEGGYIVGGKTYSNDGDVSGNHGDVDIWIAKLDMSGNITWQKTMGGTGMEELRDIKQTSDGGFIIAAFSSSDDGDVTYNNGYLDYWIIKTDATGNITWQKSYGGSSEDHSESIMETQDGYVVGGYTYSSNGDVSDNHGYYDYWLTKIDKMGDLLWEKTLGGSESDLPYSLGIAEDGGIFIFGFTASNDGDVTNNHPNNYTGEKVSDYWLVKFNPSEVLPLTLLSFNAMKQQNDVLTQWQTTSEMNVSHFELQRSANGVNFISIANINAANSSTINNYRFTDVNVMLNNPGKQYYYRLKMVDKDGQFKYSNVAVINIPSGNHIKIYPNPARNFIQIDGIQKGVSIEVNDASGKLVKRFISNASNRYVVSDLHRGLFFIKIHDKENATVSKLVIE